MKKLKASFDYYYGLGFAIGISSDGAFILVLPFIGIVIEKRSE